VKINYTLKTFITNKQNEIQNMYAALFVKLEVMDWTIALMDTYNFSGYAVDDDYIFDSMALLLAGIGLSLFFLGRSVSHSVTSTIATVISVSSLISSLLD